MGTGTRLILRCSPKSAAGGAVSLTSVTWTIQNEAEAVHPTPFEGSVWKWRLRSETSDHLLVFRVTGTAMSMSHEALPAAGSAARTTGGFSEVEQVLTWEVPPDRIEVNSVEVRRLGGLP